MGNHRYSSSQSSHWGDGWMGRSEQSKYIAGFLSDGKDLRYLRETSSLLHPNRVCKSSYFNRKLWPQTLGWCHHIPRVLPGSSLEVGNGNGETVSPSRFHKSKQNGTEKNSESNMLFTAKSEQTICGFFSPHNSIDLLREEKLHQKPRCFFLIKHGGSCTADWCRFCQVRVASHK